MYVNRYLAIRNSHQKVIKKVNFICLVLAFDSNLVKHRVVTMFITSRGSVAVVKHDSDVVALWASTLIGTLDYHKPPSLIPFLSSHPNTSAILSTSSAVSAPRPISLVHAFLFARSHLTITFLSSLTQQQTEPNHSLEVAVLTFYQFSWLKQPHHGPHKSWSTWIYRMPIG